MSTFSKSLALLLGLMVVGVQVSPISQTFPSATSKFRPFPSCPLNFNTDCFVRVKVASSYGINVIPYGRLQKYVQGIDLRSAVQDNVALKVSFGTTFALAGFMSF